MGAMRLAWTVGALFALTMANGIAAAAPAAMEGTWRIERPQPAFRPADGKPIPFNAAGRKLYQENVALAAKRDFSFDPTMATCSSPGVPRVMLTDKRFKIFVRPDVVNILFEWNRLLRQINVRDTPKEPDFGTMMGKSWGSWEGDTLVVRTSGLSRKKLIDGLLPESDDLVLVERIRLIDADHLEDRITITDPGVFTRSWEAIVRYVRQPDEIFPEDVCLDRRAAGQPPIDR